MAPPTLIGADDLAARLAREDVRLLDCRARLDDPLAGRMLWAAGHIPGAFHADLERDLSAPPGPADGRHPLPEPIAFIDWCRRHGVDDNCTVVACDDVGGAFAARLWWLLAVWLGHPATFVLDGGLAAWRARGGALTEAEPRPVTITDWSPSPDDARRVSTAAVAAAARGGHEIVVDARAEPRYAGREEPVDPVAGHVPGARNRPFQDNLDAEGYWHPPARLARELQSVTCGTPAERVIHMCGSGVTACHNLLAMEHAGMGGSRLYAGSWSEWIRDPDRPVETGAMEAFPSRNPTGC